MAYDVQIRPELYKSGYQDADIGYDQARKVVTLQGKDFLGGQDITNVSGSTFTDRQRFDDALKRFRQPVQPQPVQAQPVQAQPATQPSSPYQGAVFTPAEQDMDWRQRLVYYASNPEALQNEYQRAQQARGIYAAMGDQERLRAADEWIGRLDAIGGTSASTQQPEPFVNPMDTRINDLITMLLGAVQNPQQIDPYSTPEYAAAQAQAARGTQEATRAAQEAFGSAGFGRSTALGERVARIGNDAQEYLMTQVIPSIVAQKRAEEQQRLSNLFGILDPLISQQQTLDTRQQAEDERQFRDRSFERGVFESDRAFDYGKEQDALAQRNLEEEKAYRAQRDTEDDIRWWADYERRGQEFAAQMGLNWAQLNQREKERLSDEAYRRDRLNFEMEQAQRSGNADFEEEKRGLVDAIRMNEMTPNQALRQIEEDLSLGFYTTQQAEELKKILGTISSNRPAPEPSTTEEKKNFEDYLANLPTDRELEKEAKSKGLPLFDYRSYMKDPNGNFAGLTFEKWRELYGPRLKQG